MSKLQGDSISHYICLHFFAYGFDLYAMHLSKLVFTLSMVLLMQESEGCRYWVWVDPEMCQRSKDIIPGLIRTKNKLEAKIETLQENSKLQEAKLRRLKMYLFVHWVVAVVWILLFNSGP